MTLENIYECSVSFVAVLGLAVGMVWVLLFQRR